MKSYKETTDDLLDPMNCPLHMAKMTGDISFTTNSDGDYHVNSPSCVGCSLGLEENEAKQLVTQEKQLTDEDLLPIGSYLLPEDLKDAIRTRNRRIYETVGDWGDDGVIAIFRVVYPEEYATHMDKIRQLSSLYSEEVLAICEYQKTHAS